MGMPIYLWGSISNFICQEPKQVPSLVVQCIWEVENRGISRVGLYKEPSPYPKEVENCVKDYLKNKITPNLTNFDIYSVCEILKRFLEELDESLIPVKDFKYFYKASKKKNIKKMETQVNKLPPANKNTLSLILLHLNRIYTNPECRVTKKEIAKIFASIIGSFNKDYDKSEYPEAKLMVMERLLDVPRKYWSRVLSIERLADLNKSGSSQPRRINFVTKILRWFNVSSRTEYSSYGSAEVKESKCHSNSDVQSLK